MQTVSEIAQIIEQVAPCDTACAWDNVGLQVGNPDTPVRAILFALDVTHELAREAEGFGANLIVTHHPLIFKARSSMAETDPPARLIADLIRRGLSLYAAHTNLDVAPKVGVNAALADALGLRGCTPLLPVDRELMAKVVTFVPEGSADAVRRALAAAGAGAIGEYAECSFALRGEGTFLGGEAASPTVGQAGQFERTPEIRLEMIVPRRLQAKAVGALLAAHPYEEPAFDIYPLLNNPRNVGLGLIGELEAAMEFPVFCELIRAKLGIASVRAVWNPNCKRNIRRIAVLGGGGGGEVVSAAKAGADAFVTGDVKHHDGLAALEHGLAVVDAGHFATERPGLERLAEYVRARAGSPVHVSSACTDPFATPAGHTP
jgi:dinuclear metal center YbgI/SA1388 family protein